jgi:hypothetical protein
LFAQFLVPHQQRILNERVVTPEHGFHTDIATLAGYGQLANPDALALKLS